MAEEQSSECMHDRASGPAAGGWNAQASGASSSGARSNLIAIAAIRRGKIRAPLNVPKRSLFQKPIRSNLTVPD